MFLPGPVETLLRNVRRSLAIDAAKCWLMLVLCRVVAILSVHDCVTAVYLRPLRPVLNAARVIAMQKPKFTTTRSAKNRDVLHSVNELNNSVRLQGYTSLEVSTKEHRQRTSVMYNPVSDRRRSSFSPREGNQRVRRQYRNHGGLAYLSVALKIINSTISSYCLVYLT